MKDFCRALSTHRKAHVILLVDAESAVDGTLGQRVRELSVWNPGTPVDDDQIHFMVQVMETWFLADQGALKSYYGNAFEVGRIPNTNDVSPY